jgi:hypothetical protein
MRLYPCVFNAPVFFLQCNSLLSDFFYEIISDRQKGLFNFEARRCFVNLILTYTYPYIRFTNPTSVNSQLNM